MPITIDNNYAPRIRRAHPILTAMIAGGAQHYARLLETFLAFLPDFRRIAVKSGSDSSLPYWVNGFIPALDAISIYGIVANNRPQLYLEIGAGNGVPFARQAIRDHKLPTRILLIDPSPLGHVDALCDATIRQPLEETDLSIFTRLAADDVVFINGSHRAFQNSYATVFLTHVVPSLAAGVIYGLHAVFLPLDYGESVLSPEWPDDKLPYARAEIESQILDFISHFFNEQYLMAAYLLGGGAGDQILLPCAWITSQAHLLKTLMPIWDLPELDGIEPWGGSFWMKRG